MHIYAKDLNLLSVFEALMGERSVSLAARKLSLSQPALSHALSRLRRDFDDDLFVRSGKGMTPTPRALELNKRVSLVLRHAQLLYEEQRAFVPKTIQARWNIATTDYFEALLLPRLLPYLSEHAPGITTVIRPTPGVLPKVELENGSLDVAIAGFYGELPEGFFKRVLFKETFVCVARKGHPRVGKHVSLETFVELEHLLVSPQGDLFGAVDEALEKKRLKRRIVAGVANFHSPAAIVASTDYVVTVPKRIAQLYVETHPVRWFEPPLAVPGFTLVAVWHARTHRSRLHAWLRDAIDTLTREPK